MKQILVTAACALMIGSTAFAQRETPSITTHPVRDNIYMLEGQGGNIGVSVGDDGILIIDDQYPGMVGAIRKALADLDSGELKFILNTHFHGDHTGGNKALGESATIIAHENVRKRLANGKDLSDAMERQGLPTITYADSASIHFNGEEIKAIHFPTGHTDTDSVIFFTESNVVHMGDHFFNGRFPFVDLGSGGDVAQYIANVKKVIGQIDDDTKVIPGHGPLANKADLQTFVDTLEETIAIIREGMEAGKDAKTLSKEGLPEKYRDWGQGFIKTAQWISTVHNSYSD